jgi:hypothetical protein
MCVCVCYSYMLGMYLSVYVCMRGGSTTKCRKSVLAVGSYGGFSGWRNKTDVSMQVSAQVEEVNNGF